jgi:hypothetical protein
LALRIDQELAMTIVGFYVKCHGPGESALTSRIYSTGDAVFNPWTSLRSGAFRFVARDADQTIEDARAWARAHMGALRLNLRVPDGKKLTITRIVRRKKVESR